MANLVLGGGGGEAAAYTIDQSLRFNLGDSAYLSRTPGSDGNRKTWTFSFWYKCVDPSFPGDRDILSDSQAGAPTDEHWFRFGIRGTNNQLLLFPGYNYNTYATDAFFRDVGAWYHIVLRVDTTQASWDDRVRVYVNGELKAITNVWSGSSGVPPQDWVTGINSTDKQELMVYSYGTDVFVDGYLAEVYMIDGQSLAPSSFGETDEDTNQWKPIDSATVKDAVTFGTNGFYLKFQDSSDFGDDSSGNGNDYTATNLVATDQMKDSPTNNFCTLNPLPANYGAGSRLTYQDMSEGNLKTMGNTTTDGANVSSTIAFTEGKWYFECYVVGVSTSYNYPRIGMIDTPNTGLPSRLAGEANTLGVTYKTNGDKDIAGTSSSYGDTFTTGDIVGMAIDADNGAAYFSKNGTWQNSGVPTSGASKTNAAYTWTSGTIEFTPSWIPYTTAGGGVANFGSDSSFAGNKTAGGNADSNGVGDFFYEPPSLFLSLCTSNLSDPEIKLPGDNFNTLIYDDGAGAKTGLGFQPDMVWVKARGATNDPKVTDAVRGVEEALTPSTTAAETTYDQGLLAFGADGFTVGTDDHFDSTTGSGMVAWSWKAGTTFDPTSDGDIAVASGRSNASAGFSIVKYTGEDAVKTIGHGLATAPKLILMKNLGVVQWPVFWLMADGGDGIIFFDQTGAGSNASTAYWNDTIPSATVFTVGAAQDTGGLTSPDYIAYCFADVEGYSKIGLYEGNNNADGTFIYTGFRPAWIMIKDVDSTNPWMMSDDKRSTYNVVTADLQANNSNAESTGSLSIDYVSNGFKCRTTNTTMNAAETYLYLAFAAYPFKYAPAR